MVVFVFEMMFNWRLYTLQQEFFNQFARFQ